MLLQRPRELQQRWKQQYRLWAAGRGLMNGYQTELYVLWHV